MASVRMSRDLRSTILSRAMQAFNTTNPEPELPTKDRDWFADQIAACPEQTKLKQISDLMEGWPSIPRESYYSSAGLLFGLNKIEPKAITSLRISYTDKDNPRHHSTLSFHLNSPKTMLTASGSETLSFDLSAFKDLDTYTSARERIDNFVDRKQVFRNNRNEYNETISKLLESCTTLKQFLTAWPAGESFVPDDKIAEMHTKVTRIQKARQIKEDINFDDTAVNKVVLTSKLMGN